MMAPRLVSIREIAVVRGGDKGADCHIAIVPTAPGAYDAIWQQLTPEAVRHALPGTELKGVLRYQLPNIEGIVLVLQGALGGGAARGWLLDRRMPLAVHISEQRISMPSPPSHLPSTGEPAATASGGTATDERSTHDRA
jgi:hypothetical protein